MSEYQYYEFQALDRRLTAKEMAELRSFSTRARITPTSFVNEYNWGDFRGDEGAWMDRYFDAFLYYANWGSRTVKLRLSRRLLDPGTADLYCVGDSAWARETDEHTILTFSCEDEADHEWSDESDALSGIIPVRAQLAAGDLRSLYLGWLLCAESGQLDDEEVEPPVPPGLGELDGALERFINFLRVDTDLVAVAAAASPPLAMQSSTRDTIRQWIAGLPREEKDDYLERFIAGEEPSLAAELQRLIGRRDAGAGASSAARTVGALLSAAEHARDERLRKKAERVEAETRRREQEAAAARANYLEILARREPATWEEIDDLIGMTQPASYDRAVGLLTDLRDIADAKGRTSEFLHRLDSLQVQHARKPSFLAKLRKTGLR